MDIADTKLFGEKLRGFADKVQLCIDHHGSNTGYAQSLLLRPQCGGQLRADARPAGGDGPAADQADCQLPLHRPGHRHRLLSSQLDHGGQPPRNRKAAASRGRYAHDPPLALRVSAGERSLCWSRRCSRFTMSWTRRCAIPGAARADRINALGVADGRAGGHRPRSRARSRECRWASPCVSIKATARYKVSVRTDGIIDASAICARLNGGGHRGAAGCNVEELPLEEVYPPGAALGGAGAGRKLTRIEEETWTELSSWTNRRILPPLI